MPIGWTQAGKTIPPPQRSELEELREILGHFKEDLVRPTQPPAARQGVGWVEETPRVVPPTAREEAEARAAGFGQAPPPPPQLPPPRELGLPEPASPMTSWWPEYMGQIFGGERRGWPERRRYTPMTEESQRPDWPYLPQGFGRTPPPPRPPIPFDIPPQAYDRKPPTAELQAGLLKASPLYGPPASPVTWPGPTVEDPSAARLLGSPAGRRLGWMGRDVAERAEHDRFVSPEEWGSIAGRYGMSRTAATPPASWEPWKETPTPEESGGGSALLSKFLEIPFRQWLGREAGWTPRAKQFFGATPMDVNWQGAGGGFFLGPSEGVALGGPGSEGAIHEFAHAWYDPLRKNPSFRQDFMNAVFTLADDMDPRYDHAASLARDYVYGDPYTGFKGMQYSDGGWNDHEMYAGLASGVMGNLDLLPPYIREFYEPMFAGTAQYEPLGLPYPRHGARVGSDFWPGAGVMSMPFWMGNR